MRARMHFQEALSGVLSGMGVAWPEKTVIEPPKDKKFGDLACNVAMMSAKALGKKPREVAETIREKLLEADTDNVFSAIEVAGPGFLNVTYSTLFWQRQIQVVLDAADNFGQCNLGQGRKVQVEFVSANPTGPLHIGHGRGAAVGDSLARILRKAGFDVETEYYINDAGRQMSILGLSTFTRLQQLFGKDVQLPEDCYKGDYIIDLAREVKEQHGDALLSMPEEEVVEICQQHAMTSILDGIKLDLETFRVQHDIWFSEKSLVDAGKVEKTLSDMQANGLAFEKDGALWFDTERYGDDKNRVLRKSSGDLTYFASDIAYHDDKYRRGFDLVVDIWGADHHGYVPRMKAAVQALGRKPEDLDVILVQLVNLLRAGKQVAMSTRSGEFETLADVCTEVGVDAARFMFLSRKSDSHLDFDLELAKERSMDNPVYYVQYAHARICSLKAKAAEQGVTPGQADMATLAGLDTEADLDMLRLLDQFPDTVESAAKSLGVHQIGFYLREVASSLHRYYTLNPVLAAGEATLVASRLMLLDAVAQVLRNGLDLMGVSAPDRM
ncbi:arginine--tRNA ligase [Desulfovibrio inopinatus]|uniref:arginine--tRNA ligase n=1 Tax=Desulfovibrio inopinatus TaxID=102109 RepID=UPI0003FFDF7B|nr:arginine--tRNA ligase [Desulfovibrio inopinatus]